MKIICSIIILGFLFGCRNPSQEDAPSIMSKEQALHILNNEDPYSKDAMSALKFHTRDERVVDKKRATEQLLQLDTDLLNISMVMGKPPRSGPWPEDEFQELLLKQEELKKAQPVN